MTCLYRIMVGTHKHENTKHDGFKAYLVRDPHQNQKIFQPA